jgi:Protein of unknown function (DUF2510)
MQEFESISASSYDPSALATKLTAKAAEGWSVVAIVPTGGDVTAFVSREKGGATESATSEEMKSESEAAPDTPDDETPAPELPADTEPAVEPVVETQAEPVAEPSGWAIAPEPASTTPEPTGVQPIISPTSTYQPTATPTYEPLPASTPSVTTPAAVSPAAAATPAAAPAVPAGWYADPAGRFELRYWDGSTWTEHVSRAGQQFTDPPVA